MKRENLKFRIKLIGALTLAGLFQYSGVSAQTDKETNDAAIIEQTIEMIAENAEDEDLDYTTLFDDLNFLVNHPINLNNCTAADLEELSLLNDIQINNLLSHIEENGKLISIYELQSVEGFDLQTISVILPFVRVNRDFETLSITPKEVLRNGTHELFVRSQVILEDQGGFLPIDEAELASSPNSRYLGSKPKLYTRYRFKYGRNISVGFTGEKDAGEEFFKGSQKQGFDYVSAHAFVKDLGVVKRFAIGDYQVQLGQALTMWSGLGFGKSADVMNIKKTGQGIRPYTSVDENIFLRGAAATIAVKKFEFTGFYSRKRIDANISASDTISQEVIEVTSFQQSGFHSTPGELADKDAIDEAVVGGNVSYKSRKLSVGITAVSTAYGATLNRSLQEYSQFDFTGDANFNAGADYNYIHKNVNLFGEISRSQNGGLAYLNGAIISLDPRLSVSVLQRHFDRNFQNLFSNALGESSRNVNEDGWYLGVITRINRRWTLSAYCDVFKFPWLSYKADAPARGTEWLAQLDFTPSKKLGMYFRGRVESKQENTAEDTEGIDYLVDRRRSYLRYHASYKLSDALQLKSRVEISRYVLGDAIPEMGYVLYQDVAYKMSSLPLSFSMRFALFETDTYNARIYAYESDVLYAYSIPAYYYRGTRMYALMHWDVTKKIDFWLRFAQTYYDDRDVISSGLTEIQGNTKSEVKAQVRIKL